MAFGAVPLRPQTLRRSDDGPEDCWRTRASGRCHQAHFSLIPHRIYNLKRIRNAVIQHSHVTVSLWDRATLNSPTHMDSDDTLAAVLQWILVDINIICLNQFNIECTW